MQYGTLHLSRIFWNNCTRTGRVNEMQLTQALYFNDGLIAGLRKLVQMQSVGLGMMKARRMNPLEAVGAGHRCKDAKGIHAMLAKAKAIEAARKAGRAPAQDWGRFRTPATDAGACRSRWCSRSRPSGCRRPGRSR